MHRPTAIAPIRLAAAFMAIALATPARADDTTRLPADVAASEHLHKLTAGWYDFSDGSRGQDVNLRYGAAVGNVWIGYFRLPDQEFSQWRGGWDDTLGDAVRVMPSIQLASGGFAGGSLQVETGAPWFVGAGLGRTNLRPYWNLNFDPNDSYTLSVGRRDDDGRTFALQLVRDNRQNPDQRHLHFLYRQPLPDGQRLTADLLRKDGLVDGAPIVRWGLSLTYDWPRFFVRLAYDPRTNFTPVDLTRIAIGTRF